MYWDTLEHCLFSGVLQYRLGTGKIVEFLVLGVGQCLHHRQCIREYYDFIMTDWGPELNIFLWISLCSTNKVAAVVKAWASDL